MVNWKDLLELKICESEFHEEHPGGRKKSLMAARKTGKVNRDVLRDIFEKNCIMTPLVPSVGKLKETNRTV